jgi:hypothetical protein
MTMDRRCASAILLWLVVSACATAGEIYRWTDENGKVHFGDRPKASEAEAVGSTGAPSTGPDAATEATLDRQGRYLESLRREREKKEAAEAKAAAERKRRAHNCKVARSRLEMYRRAGAIVSYNNKGERQFHDKQQRAAAISRARKDVRYWCR